MAHGLSELGPSFLREGVVLPIEPLIAELDTARHETAFLELLECRVNRPGLGTPVAGEPLLQFPDHLVPVHRLLRQEQEQPKRDGSNLHASRCGRGHQLTPCRANRVLVYMRRYPTQWSISTDRRNAYIHRYTTCVETLLKEDFNEMGNPRESEGGPDCVPVARQEIRRSESGVPVRAARKGLGRREGTGRDPVRQPWRRAVPLQGGWRRAVQLRCDYQDVQAHGPSVARHGRNRAHRGCGPASAACRRRGARGDGPRVPDERKRRFREHAAPVPRV